MKEWWKSAVIYQIYPRSFQDTNGDGVGDLPGITGRLDYLQWLGIDAVWISPIYPSPMQDFGYDVSNYQDVDAVFGALEDFDELVNEAHRRGIKVILDFVPNHTSREHPWFIESRSSRDNPKRDWYIWRDAKPDGSPPNNWRGLTSMRKEGSAWRWDERTGQYYLASFSPTQPDLNWRNPEVRKEMLDALRFWLKRGVDGFRIDMIDFLSKDEDFRDEPPTPGDIEIEYFPKSIRHLNQPETLEYIREMRRVIHAYHERVMIGEVTYFLPIEKLADYHGEGDLLDLPFNFRLILLPFEAREVREFVGEYDTALTSRDAWPNYTLSNHDVPRTSRHGEAASRVAAMMLLTLRGTPFVYYGEEIGMANVEIPPDHMRDPWPMFGTDKSRDSVRTPMQWSTGPQAGFSRVEPWLPVAPDYQKVNVAARQEAPASILNLYRRLLSLRKATPALHSGAYEPLPSSENCFVYARRQDGQTALVALNFSGEEKTVNLPDGENGWSIHLSTHLDRDGKVSSEVLLRPHEGLVLL